MESQLKKLPHSEVEVTIDIDTSELQTWRKKALNSIAKNAQMPGFRAGKVPLEKIKEKIGEHAILAEILDMALPKWYEEIIAKHQLRPLSEVRPEILSSEPLRIKLVFAVWPEVKIGDPKKLRTKKKEAKVSPEDKDKEIQSILQGNVEWVQVDRPSKNSDKVEVDFTGFNQEGQKLPNAESRNHPLILGSDTMIPGFEENILGMKSGEEKDFDITFPANYHAEKMRGQKTKFHIKINQVFEKKEAKWDDELAQKLTQGRQTKITDLEKEIEKVLLEHRQKMTEQEYETELISELADKSELEVPQVLVERVLEGMIHNFRHDIEARGLTWDQYIQHHKTSEEEMKNKWRDGAGKRAREELVLQAYGDENKITADDKEINQEIEHMVNHIADKAEQKRALDHYSKPEIREHIGASIRLRETIRHLIKTHESK